jgi:hypothetical protein
VKGRGVIPPTKGGVKVKGGIPSIYKGMNGVKKTLTPSIFHWLVGVYEPLFSLFGIVIIFGF